MNLRQKDDEILMFYYKRIAFIMFQIRAKNRDINSLIQTKSLLLNTVIRVFVRKIFNRYVQIEAFRHLTKCQSDFDIILLGLGLSASRAQDS